MSESYDVVLLVEQALTAADARQVLSLHEDLDDPVLTADALDAALASHWGPDDLDRRRAWALRLGDAAAHLIEFDHSAIQRLPIELNGAGHAPQIRQVLAAAADRRRQ